ncbi:hypothetical protein ACFLIM_32870 [Nonomuraea sp. M3C6]|uniref:Uncharacterized protein n=1 Tax=Nonomuraea marmarensis TaxID=3351344 RepID=A0ABW7ALW8_9ACTN
METAPAAVLSGAEPARRIGIMSPDQALEKGPKSSIAAGDVNLNANARNILGVFTIAHPTDQGPDQADAICSVAVMAAQSINGDKPVQ